MGYDASSYETPEICRYPEVVSSPWKRKTLHYPRFRWGQM